MSQRETKTNNEGVDFHMVRCGRLLLKLLLCCGYFVRFKMARCDTSGDCAVIVFTVDTSSLPSGVAFRHLRDPNLLALMSLCLHRKVTVSNGRGELMYTVPVKEEIVCTAKVV